MKNFILIICLILLGLCLPVSAFADDLESEHYQLAASNQYNTHNADTIAPISVTITKANSMYRGPRRILDVTIDGAEAGIGGFDMLFGYDSAPLNLIEVIPGSALFGDSVDPGCGWEYFTYAPEVIDSCDICPQTLLRIIGIAETNNGDIHPSCFATDSLPVTLFSFDMQLSDSCIYDCQFYPLRFFWTDCGDNALSTRDGSTILLSRSIAEFEGGVITDSNYGWPTYFGAQSECFATDTTLGGLSTIDFMNGGVDVACADTAPTPGDCNRDGTQFSERDLELLLQVFTNPFEGCAGCGDVNRDGHINRIDDLQTFLNEMNGEQCIPFGDTNASFAVNINPGSVTVSTDARLAASQFLFDGYVIAFSPPIGMILEQHYDGSVTRVLIYSTEGASYRSGQVFTYAGSANLYSVETTNLCGDYIGATINTDVLRISIESTVSSIQGQHELIDVIWEHGPTAIGGFDLLIGYETAMLSFQTATMGDALYGEADSSGCEWEYFTYRYGAHGNCEGNCPTGLLRVVGIAETNNGANHPSCFVPQQFPAVLFTLDFLVSNDRVYECQTAPITFFWVDCGDNTISSQYGDTLFLSQSVYDYDGSDITDIQTGWPTYTGSQVSCYPYPANNRFRTVRRIEFSNGGLSTVCPDTIGLRGDLNLNQVPNEIADAVLYSNYFVYGSTVFDINYTAQVAASDVNGDGVPLTIEDLLYLIRIVVGDALPYPKPNLATDTAYIAQVDNYLNVFAPPGDSLGGAYIILQGNVTPALPENMSHFSIKYAYDANENITRVLLYSMEQGKSFTSGLLLSNIGMESLISANVATYYGGFVETILDTPINHPDKPLPSAFALHQNYPNPFNNSTTISFDLPIGTMVALHIYNNLGQSVYEHTADLSAGIHSFEWDGSDRTGKIVASGIYYYRIDAERFTQTRKMLLLK